MTSLPDILAALAANNGSDPLVRALAEHVQRQEERIAQVEAEAKVLRIAAADTTEIEKLWSAIAVTGDMQRGQTLALDGLRKLVEALANRMDSTDEDLKRYVSAYESRLDIHDEVLLAHKLAIETLRDNASVHRTPTADAIERQLAEARAECERLRRENDQLRGRLIQRSPADELLALPDTVGDYDALKHWELQISQRLARVYEELPSTVMVRASTTLSVGIGIRTLSELTAYTHTGLLKKRGMGALSVAGIESALAKFGLSLSKEQP